MPVSVKLRNRARGLRRDQTDAEGKLWARLRTRQLCGLKFRRQHPIGPYVADLCCVERGIVVELDGGQHATRAEADQKRSTYLEQRGYRVLRFWDNEVLLSPDAVLEQIVWALNNPHPGSFDILRTDFPWKGEGWEKMTPKLNTKTNEGATNEMVGPNEGHEKANYLTCTD